MTNAKVFRLVLAPVLAAMMLTAVEASAQYGPPPPPPPYAGGPLGSASQRPHLYFGFELNGFLIMKQVTDQVGYMGQGGGGNFTLGYRFGPHIALELNLGVTYHSEDFGAYRLLDSLFLVTPTVDVKVHFSSRGRLQPYLQAGVGYGYLGATYFDGFACDFGCDTTFAQGPLFQIGGGFDYWLTPWVTFGTRVMYRMVYLNDSPYGASQGQRGASNFVNGIVVGFNGTYHFF